MVSLTAGVGQLVLAMHIYQDLADKPQNVPYSEYCKSVSSASRIEARRSMYCTKEKVTMMIHTYKLPTQTWKSQCQTSQLYRDARTEALLCLKGFLIGVHLRRCPHWNSHLSCSGHQMAG